jgi:hypothetical protein
VKPTNLENHLTNFFLILKIGAIPKMENGKLKKNKKKTEVVLETYPKN